ncbi:TetR/AcrR family transcriptional regulator [Streptomyces fulvorobeus]|uniref:AcrR family transcriptional regulator n=1 Tax=Streptomyces fulvorobeus TaxID=284028 RepID=A0A7J0CAW8_9ACTN|nr:TetR/AcrR family transcriptional regulator [Streptomyces fulvorobeus]NYE42605.1 AcrR family transcriptional regulator [Streptomyces fulvorobeus]GFM99013.1 TetR family transcriptional regulator [Streptomyces fulvorobeus]
MATSTVRTPAGAPARSMRADARRNYDRLLNEARASFAEHGTDASLEDVARQAGVGIGTLYRHFPNRQALMYAVFQEALAALLARSRELAEGDHPCHALVEWLGAVVTHTGEYRGVAQALMSATRDETSALARCNTPLREAGARLLARAQESGAVRAEVSIDDLMQLTNAIALAAEQAPDDPALADRLLALTLQGLKGPAAEQG